MGWVRDVGSGGGHAYVQCVMTGRVMGHNLWGNGLM